MMNGYGGHGWGMGWSWFIGLILLIFIIWFVVKIVSQRGNNKPAEQKTALDILKERYARGEINKREFEDKKKDLF